MPETLNIVIEKGATEGWLQTIMQTGAQNSGTSQAQKRTKIQKVPAMLRGVELNEKCYDPMVVSIGPYHHGIEDELKEVQELKISVAHDFVSESEQPIEVLYKKVEEVAVEARSCYAEGSTDQVNDEEFTQMMFLDGCFILQFILCYVREPAKLKMKRHVAEFVKRDLFLLENQLPFLVLKSLMSLRFKDEAGNKLIEDFLNRIRGFSRKQGSGKHKAMKFFCKKGETEEVKNNDVEHVHLLEFFRSRLVGGKAQDNNNLLNQNGDHWSSYRSAKELKTVGIHFRPSENDHFTDIKFTSTLLAGILKLPRIIIDDSTKSLLLNLVAYERCPDAPDDLGVTSYICFLDSLIDQEEDVKELRSKGILLNYLGSDKQVADLFNEITTELVPNPEAFSKLANGIELHYRNLIKKWIAEWLHTHFSSPWTFLAFVAAIFALVLGALQAYSDLIIEKDSKNSCTCANVTRGP